MSYLKSCQHLTYVPGFWPQLFLTVREHGKSVYSVSRLSQEKLWLHWHQCLLEHRAAFLGCPVAQAEWTAFLKSRECWTLRNPTQQSPSFDSSPVETRCQWSEALSSSHAGLDPAVPRYSCIIRNFQNWEMHFRVSNLDYLSLESLFNIHFLIWTLFLLCLEVINLAPKR